MHLYLIYVQLFTKLNYLQNECHSAIIPFKLISLIIVNKKIKKLSKYEKVA